MGEAGSWMALGCLPPFRRSMLLTSIVVAVTIALWATGRLPEYLTALLFLTIAVILRLAPVDVIFSGFTSEAFWLVLSGFVLGAAISRSGLAARLADPLQRHMGGSWLRLVAGVVVASYALAFVMPSNMGRIALLMPIVLSIADRLGLVTGTRGRAGLALAVGVGTYQLSGSILPANVPNLVLSGAVEASYNLRLPYLPYLLLNAPVLGVLKGVLVTVCVVRLFPATLPPPQALPASVPWSRKEKRLLILLGLILVAWMSDGVHGIAPAWVGLLAACICLLPRIGLLDGPAFSESVNLRVCLYVGGILGLSALVAHSGLGSAIGHWMMRLLPLSADSPLSNLGYFVALSSVLSLAVTANGVPAVFTPLAQELASGTDLPLITVLMSQVVGYSTPWLPYQASPIVVAMAMGGVRLRDGVVLCMTIAIATAVLLVPLHLLWMRLLHYWGG